MKYIVSVQASTGAWMDKLCKVYVHLNAALRYAEEMLHIYKAVKIEAKEE